MMIKNSKIIRGISAVIATIMLMSVNVFAKPGDYIGSSVYSDIVVYINHYAIPSTNYNGDMYVNIQSLKKYGFKTSWDEASKTTTIELSGEKTIEPINTYTPAALNVGKVCWNFNETDVKVCINGNYVEAYGSGGEEILIKAKDLAYLDNVSYEWVQDIKSVKIWVKNGLEMRSTPQYPSVYTGEFPGTWNIYYTKDGITGEETTIPTYIHNKYKESFNKLDIHLYADHTASIGDNSYTWEFATYASGSVGIHILNQNGVLAAFYLNGSLILKTKDDSILAYKKV